MSVFNLIELYAHVNENYTCMFRGIYITIKITALVEIVSNVEIIKSYMWHHSHGVYVWLHLLCVSFAYCWGKRSNKKRKVFDVYHRVNVQFNNMEINQIIISFQEGIQAMDHICHILWLENLLVWFIVRTYLSITMHVSSTSFLIYSHRSRHIVHFHPSICILLTWFLGVI